MKKRTVLLLSMAALGVGLAPAPAHAWLGVIGKLGKLGKVGKAAGTAAKVGKVAKVAKVGSVAAAGMTSAVAAERAGVLLAGLGDDAARSAAFVARSAEGEVLWATRAAGTEKLASGSVGEAVGALGRAGERPKVFLDPSMADAAPALAKEHPAVELVLADGEKALPLRQKPGGEVGDLVVDTGEKLVDLADYVGTAEPAEEGEVEGWQIGLGACVAAVLGYVVWKRWRDKATVAPA